LKRSSHEVLAYNHPAVKSRALPQQGSAERWSRRGRHRARGCSAGDYKNTEEIEMGGCDVAQAEGAESKKSIAEALLRDMQGTAAEKLALFEKLKARGGFAGQDRAELLRIERMLRTFAATEKLTVSGRSRSVNIRRPANAP
jgi:hypothetical protein